jgi:hypothetical protein
LKYPKATASGPRKLSLSGVYETIGSKLIEQTKSKEKESFN